MEQKIPVINDTDIDRIIARDFPHLEPRQIKNILEKYVSENDKGRNRIYACILKLSDGDVQLIRHYVERANIDYLDLISLAEYPDYSDCAFESDLSIEEEGRLINDDWTQYETWLNKVQSTGSKSRLLTALLNPSENHGIAQVESILQNYFLLI